MGALTTSEVQLQEAQLASCSPPELPQDAPWSLRPVELLEAAGAAACRHDGGVMSVGFGSSTALGYFTLLLLVE